MSYAEKLGLMMCLWALFAMATPEFTTFPEWSYYAMYALGSALFLHTPKKDKPK